MMHCYKPHAAPDEQQYEGTGEQALDSIAQGGKRKGRYNTGL
jgi:hypothetical protein